MLLSLIHPLISNLIPSTPKVIAGIQPHLPRDPPTSTLSQHTLSSLSPSASPPPLLSQLSLPLPPGCALDSILSQQCPLDPSPPDVLDISPPTPGPLSYSPSCSTLSTPISILITRWLLHNGNLCFSSRLLFPDRPTYWTSSRDPLLFL